MWNRWKSIIGPHQKRVYSMLPAQQTRLSKDLSGIMRYKTFHTCYIRNVHNVQLVSKFIWIIPLLIKYHPPLYSSHNRVRIVVSVNRKRKTSTPRISTFNPLNPELNPICCLLALLAHHFLHVSRIRVKLLTIRLLMSYIYIYICVCVCIHIWSAYSWCF